MKILHVANFNHKKNGQIFYDVSRKLTNGFIRDGHSVFDFSDRDIARAGNPLGARKFGVGSANRRLLETCENYRPDLICFGHADVIRPPTLAAIREIVPTVRIVQWNVDPLFEPDNVGRILTKVDHVDLTLITTAGEQLRQFSRPNNRVAFMPNPVDPSIESGRAFAETDQEFDLIYCIGNPATPRLHDGRRSNVPVLAQHLIDSVPEARFAFYGLFGKGPIFGTAYQNALRNARMGLNLSRRSDNYLYSSDRMAHLTGNGLLTFVDRATRFDELYRDDEIVFYESLDDLVSRIRFYKRNDDERRRVAENGWRRSVEMFDSTRVARYLIEQAFELPFSAPYEWPTETY